MGSQASIDRPLADAVRLHQKGDFAGAIRAYEKVVRKTPGHAAALNLLGLALFQTGKLEKAATSIGRALSLKPDLPDAHYNLGIVLHALARYEEAVAHFEQFLALKPGDAEARNSLGASLKELGRLEEAIDEFQKAIWIWPNYPQANLNLGSTLVASGRNTEAIPHLQKAIMLRPSLGNAHSQLGNALLAIGRTEEALRAHQRAIALKPGDGTAHYDLATSLRAAERYEEALQQYDLARASQMHSPDIHVNRGTLLTRLERYDEALKSFERALAIDPAHADAHTWRGATLQLLGQLEKAQADFERSIQLNPKNVEPYYFLARLRRVEPRDSFVKLMEELLPEVSNRRIEDQISLHYSLGKVYSDLGEHERSFQHMLKANFNRRLQVGYDEAETLRFFDRLKAGFTQALLQKSAGQGHSSNMPIFIVGMPRSGTSLVEQILSSHPKVFGAGERDEFIRSALNLGKGTPLEFPEIVESMTAEDLRRFGQTYLDKMRALAPAGIPRITDKLPANFEMVGFIHLTLPNARIIHARRDPLDNCISCFTTLFEHAHTYMNDLGDLGRYYRAYEALMDHWRRVLPEGVMLDVQYEDVIEDLEGQARRIVAHCGLEWDDACLAFHKTERPVRTASVAQVRQPIYRSSIGRAQAYRDQLGPLLKALGIE